MSELPNLLQLLASSGQPPIAFEWLVKFVAFVSRLKDDILLAQPASFNLVGDLHPVLPPSIQGFLWNEAQQGVLFPMDKGCKVNYHHNFRVHDGQQIYYDKIPDILQIGEHQFAERKLVNMWIIMMLLSWTSAMNCAQIYNMAHISNSPPLDWQFNLQATSDQIYDAFTILLLLEDCQAHEPNCKIPLANNHDHFCPTHSQLNQVCAIVHCLLPAVTGRKTCMLPEHEAVEKVHDDCGQARFQLKERLHRAQLAHPQDALPIELANISKLVDDDNTKEDFDFNHRGLPIPVTATPVEDPTARRKTLRAQFGHKRTHNEQLFVAPCGIIIAREMFYHAEALYSVIEMIKCTYRVPGTKPDHIFFDNNCSIAKAVKTDPFFQNVGLTVDVFHFKCKHSEKDQFCQDHCNPTAYPELLGEGKQQWYFNSSIAEQTNSWLGGYHAICREMQAHRYNFFLDEMIRRRNIMTREKLAKGGCMPGTWPLSR
ncbi:hypothetical protein CPB84DRAFT_1816137 [Gymnopilus junonius]|uniref:CxC6 like cysteine cluster associated with KDZ domain-containing protein n=1 Tax=Gymnopilus junonius TaxID=109634 RepID=A0A9P5NI09_GYMJU|nr:hypothetical protein CPB84DRAFT_1816137 [Gymnopilus junonius]